MTRLAILLLAGLAACAAPRVSGSGAHAHYTRLIEETVAEVQPSIVAMLGTRWERKFRVVVDEGFTRFLGDTRAFDRRVRIGARALMSDEQLRLTLAHELVHVHMTGPWRELPETLQEGVAIWVSLCALGREGELQTIPPGPESCLAVFTTSYSDYKDADRGRQNELDYAATWIARRFFEGSGLRSAGTGEPGTR